ncbi:MAG: c-type cytochrome domain-containing protein [Verrucomicrobiota bacterium]
MSHKQNQGQPIKHRVSRFAGKMILLAALLSSLGNAWGEADFSAVHAIFDKHCIDCHESKDPEANLVLEDFASLIKGGESGASVVPGKADESLLAKMIEGKIEKDGKKLIMPPGKKKKLDASEIAAIKSWINAGAVGPTDDKAVVKELTVPKILPSIEPRKSINALAFSPANGLIASARYGAVDLIASETRRLLRTLAGHRGNVNAIVFSADGSQLFAASGENALFGEVKQWKVADGALVRTFRGHKDTIYSIALSPDGKILATGSYDQKIKLWDVVTGKELNTLSGHNGAVFGLSFRPDGKILASASADRTVKLWDVTKGERRDTLTQSLKELYTVAFSPDGKRLFAGGVDNRIRVWQISDAAAETTNPILESRFAHEGSILRLVFSNDGKQLLSSAEDRTVKVWDAVEVKEKLVLDPQPDWCTGLTFAGNDKMIVAGRLDGSLGFYEAVTGKLIFTNLASAAVAKQELK